MLNKYRVFKIKQVIESEKRFIKKYSTKKIFELAAFKITEFINKNFSKKKIFFICGPGNNGRDGIYSNALLKKKKINTKVYEISKEYNIFSEKKLNELLEESDVVVDCIFGLGLNRKIQNKFKKIIQLINCCKNKVIISIDLPSGINSDSGDILGISVKANITLAMGVYKPAHFLNPSKNYCGEVSLLNLNLPNLKKNIYPQIFLLEKKILENKFPSFPSNIHKYNKGHVHVIGGVMAGASRIVAYSARKTGCGLSSIIINDKDLKFYSGTEPGTIIRSSKDKIDSKKADCLVIGPGLGKSFSKKQFLEILKKYQCPIIIDADAFNIFKNYKEQFYKVLQKRKNVILTPHEGEFQRIFNQKNDKISNCLQASKLIFNNIVLKGNDTIVAFQDQMVWINNNASSSLATAGSGDMLCGIMSSLIAQKMEIKYSILASIYIHGQLSKQRNCSTVEDFMKKIPQVFRYLKNNN